MHVYNLVMITDEVFDRGELIPRSKLTTKDDNTKVIKIDTLERAFKNISMREIYPGIEDHILYEVRWDNHMKMYKIHRKSCWLYIAAVLGLKDVITELIIV